MSRTVESLMLRSSRTAKVVMSSGEWVLQNSPRVSRLADVKEVVNSPLCKIGSQQHFFETKK